ncbi:MAG: Crp/Fnr family transcriptional regulator [Caulobacter sp.]|nr:Crp/Fnr family transcriptional regulator [Caulobacter sp.]
MLRNLTLAGLAPEDFQVLGPHLSAKHVVRGEILTKQGDKVETIYFPTTALVANTVTFSDGSSVETFVMGVEGVTGLAPVLADGPCPWAVEVKAEGEVFQIEAAILRQRFDVSASLRTQLLRLSSDYQAQAAFGVGCAALHNTRGRLAKFILLNGDRAETGRLRLTQQDFADYLGVQRTTVNEASQDLRNAGAIRHHRGMVEITDRTVLKTMACECYKLHRSLVEPENGDSESTHPV